MRNLEWIVVAVVCLLISISIPIARADGLLCQARKVIGSLELPGAPFYQQAVFDIRIEDGLAFISTGRDGLYIVDISDPSEPQLLNNPQDVLAADYFDIEDGIAYLAGWDRQLQIVDVSDPARPLVLNTISTEYNPGGIDAVGDLLYTGQYPLVIYDISDPGAPVEVGRAAGDFFLRDIQVIGELAYATDNTGRLDIFDVTDPANPFVISRTEVGRNLEAVDVVDSVAYVTTSGGGSLKVIDVSDPAMPVILSSSTRGGGRGVRVVDGRLYSASCTLSVVDVADASSPEWLGEIELIGSTGVAIEVIGSLAYVVDRRFGLEIVDISGSVEPAEIGHAPGVGTPMASSLDVDGEFAIVNALGLEVYNISDPAAPRFLSRTMSGHSWGAQVRLIGTTVYESARDGLRIYDLADTGVLVLIGSIEMPSVISLTRFDVADHLVAIARGEPGARLVDVSDPTLPVEIGSIETNGRVTDVHLDNNLLFIADTEAGLRIVDITDPSNPALVGEYGLLWALSVDVVGSTAYVAAYQGGMSILDVSDPGNPTLVRAYQPDRSLSMVRIYGGLAFVASTSEHNIQIVDISDRQSPRLAGWFCANAVLPVRRGNLIYHSRNRLTISSLEDCPPCPADLNSDGLLDILDVQRFLNLYAAGDDLADLIDDERLDFYDVQAFLNLFAAGCP
jgi:hypothetical protein